MKILVTHINPHLDDILAIWLFKKFHPEFKEASLDFISAHEGNIGLENTTDKVFFGVGRGKFDEHKGDIGESAGSLVWRDLKEKKLGPKDEIELKSLDELVEWNTLIDTGRIEIGKYDEFSVPAFLRPLDNTKESSRKAVELGCEILDRVLKVLKRKQRSIKDWGKKVEFQSRFGKSYAIVSENISRDFCRRQDGDFYLMYNPKYKSVQYFTPKEGIDLEPLYKKLKEADQEASWFLHHSHHFILCGAGSDPIFKHTKLSFEELIDMAKSV
ncbi:hypothetical protein HYT18_05085 [Candidatus Microgenomates bacterium]|nr:hypothetical protein [Candidatus Microgenomates bacterium]